MICMLLTMQEQIHIAQNIYHEARGEGRLGWKMVMATTLCRVNSYKYPDSVYEVIWQRSQFSWTKDGKSDKPKDKKKFQEILKFVQEQNMDEMLDYRLTNYHSGEEKPSSWPDHVEYVTRFGGHKFYRDSTIY